MGFLGLASFPGWRQEPDSVDGSVVSLTNSDTSITGSDFDGKPFPSQLVSRLVCFALGAASLLLLVSALWQHIAAASVVSLVSATVQAGSVVGNIGTASVALVWLSFALAVVAFQGVVIMVISIYFLDKMIDE
jgi:hypothetical protein